MFVYTSDLDAFVFHDVGPKRIPSAHYWDVEEKKLLAVQTDKVPCVCCWRESFMLSGHLSLLLPCHFAFCKIVFCALLALAG